MLKIFSYKLKLGNHFFWAFFVKSRSLDYDNGECKPFFLTKGYNFGDAPMSQSLKLTMPLDTFCSCCYYLVFCCASCYILFFFFTSIAESTGEDN